MTKSKYNEARYRISPSSRKPVPEEEYLEDEYDSEEMDDEFMPDDVAEFMGEDEEDSEPEWERNKTYTLEDIVSMKVLNTNSAPGTKAFIDNTTSMIQRYLTDDEFFSTLVKLKNSERVFNKFEEARDVAVPVWIKSASHVLGKDVSQMPEFIDPVFMDVFLFDFWFLATYVKPLIRQTKKGKTVDEAMKHINKSIHYTVLGNRANDFIKRVMTPVFTYLARNTDIAG